MEKERLLNKINLILLNNGVDSNSISRIQDLIALEINKYDVIQKTRELVVVDNESQSLIKLFAGSLLVEGKSIGTAHQYSRALERFLAYIGKPLVEVKALDVKCWLADIQKNASLRTCENYRSYLSAFYKWAHTEEFVSKNPMDKIKPIKYNSGDKPPFTETEVDALRSACKTLRERAELEVLLSCGARVAELCDLQRSDINYNTLEVNIREGKGNKQRTVFINDLAMVHLIKYLNSRNDTSTSLFVNRQGKAMTPTTVRRDLKKVGNRANVDDVHPHRCRQTFATNLSKRGMDIRVIRELLGHSDINTTMGYIALDKNHIQNEYRKYA